MLCKKRFPSNNELSRKIVHIGTGPVIAMAWWLNISTEIALTTACLISGALLINKKMKLLPSLEDVERNSYGTVVYGLSITLLISLFWTKDPAAVTAGILVMAFGDGLAGLIGREIKSPYWIIWKQRKSVAGTLTMAIITILVVYCLNLICGYPLNQLQIVGITIIAISLEQISRWGIDNLTVPLAVAYSWFLFSNL